MSIILIYSGMAQDCISSFHSTSYLYIILWVSMNEGSRWIRLPIINMTLQTSDLAKLALFMYLARLLSKKTGCDQGFQERISSGDDTGWYYLCIDCTGKSFNCIIAWRKLPVVIIYWQGKNKTYIDYYRCSCLSPFVFLIAAALSVTDQQMMKR